MISKEKWSVLCYTDLFCPCSNFKKLEVRNPLKDVRAQLSSTQIEPVLIFSLFPFYHQNSPVGWYENKQEEKGEVKVDSSLWEGLSLLQHWTTFI